MMNEEVGRKRGPIYPETFSLDPETSQAAKAEIEKAEKREPESKGKYNETRKPGKPWSEH